MHPGKQRANVANSGWCGLMIRAASRRVIHALCASVCTHAFAYSMNQIKDSVMSVPAS